MSVKNGLYLSTSTLTSLARQTLNLITPLGKGSGAQDYINTSSAYLLPQEVLNFDEQLSKSPSQPVLVIKCDLDRNSIAKDLLKQMRGRFVSLDSFNLKIWTIIKFTYLLTSL